MIYSILAFLLSSFTTLLLIRFKHIHEKFSGDNDTQSPQKFHFHSTPRIGGISVLLAILITSCLAFFLAQEKGSLLLQLTVYALPAFFIGLLEDLTKKIGVKTRLLVTIVSAGLVGYFLNVWITHVQVLGIDFLLSYSTVSILLTIVAIAGLANAYNIIDGFNGLASMVAMISLLAIGYVAFKVGDPIIGSSCLISVGAIGGFFIWNYPRGLIFLGDGGAYLIGVLIACLSILLVQRNLSVSPWFALLVNAYPIFETLFTIWRRKVHQGRNPGLPDGAHFHSLIYRRLIRWAGVHESKEVGSHAQNAKTSPYLWFLSSLAVFPALIWWQTTWVLQAFTMLFCVSYVLAYSAIVKFKARSLFNLLK